MVATTSSSCTMNPVSVKLDDENFLMWKMQALGAIESSKLQRFILTSKCGGMPKKYKMDEDEKLDNPIQEYVVWEQQDQTVYTWLLASMTPSLHTRMVGCEHAYQICKQIEVYFATLTRAKVSQLRTKLKNMKKTDSLNEFLLSIKKIIDTLAAIGSPIGTSEHIQVILDGLPSEYNPLVAAMLSRADPYTIPEIEAMLMALEERVEKQNKDAFDVQHIQANLVQNQDFRNGRGSIGNYNRGRYQGSSFRGSRGRGRPFGK
ncbi:gag-polypeptide of LTR copia-type [Sesbania bispinosa]|nr:gag-polypeptide of LTR copia-type [Sesbania bispinosa]